MTPSQKLIDAAAEAYEAALVKGAANPYIPALEAAITVALRAAASICSIKAAECRDKQADVSDESVNWHAYNHGAFVAGANADAIAALIPEQEKQNDR